MRNAIMLRTWTLAAERELMDLLCARGVPHKIADVPGRAGNMLAVDIDIDAHAQATQEIVAYLAVEVL